MYKLLIIGFLGLLFFFANKEKEEEMSIVEIEEVQNEVAAVSADEHCSDYFLFLFADQKVSQYNKRLERDKTVGMGFYISFYTKEVLSTYAFPLNSPFLYAQLFIRNCCLRL